MAAARELTFQLERFEWIASDRLELAGRWNGLRGRRIAPPVLAFEAAGRRHRLRAMPGGQLDERWRATFAWDGPAIDIERAELEVGRTLVVDLPAPRRRSSADRPAEPLEERLAAAEAEAEAAREELARLREDLNTAAEETEQALTAAREVEASLREEAAGLKTELERAQGLLEQRDSQLGATRAGLERERNDLRELRDRLEEADAELARERDRLAEATEELERERDRLAEATEELERERDESGRLRQRVAEPATEAHAVDEEWPLEPAPLPPATAAAERPAPEPAPADAAPAARAAADPAPVDATTPDAATPNEATSDGAASDRDQAAAAATDEAPPVPLGLRSEEPRDERSQPVTNGDAPSIEVWAARVSGAKEEEGASESPRTLELPGLEAVKEKGAKALSSLLGHDGEEPEPVLARPRATAASRAGTRARAPRGARSRTVRQHSAGAIWAMRIAAVTVLLILVVVLAVVLNVIF
jgi:hypothetical protein